MANDKISELMREAVDLAREEGYNQGATETLAALEQFLSSLREKLTAKAPSRLRATETTTAVQQPRPVSRIRRPEDKQQLPPRMSTGILNQLVTDAYKAVTPKAASPTTIQIWIRDNRGEEVAFSSLRRTIDRLTAQGVLEEMANTKTWHYREVKKEEPSGGTPGSSNPSGMVPLRR